MRRLIITILFLFLVLITCNERVETGGPGYDPTTAWIHYNQDKIHAIDSILNAYHKRHRFHGNVLVADRGHIIYRGSFENKYMKRVADLQPNSVFQLASVSKQFTAVAVIMMEEEGLLSYDDSLGKHIPELPWPEVTIEQLLHHTAGLPNYWYIVEKYWDEKSPPCNDSIISLIARHQDEMPLYFSPGRKHDYSNTGYMILASVVERLSGMKFPDFMQERVFGPAGMKNSFICHAPPSPRNEVLSGYRPGRTRYLEIGTTVNDGSYGDKGAYSNTYDLYLWDQALFNGKLISHKSLREATTPLMLRGKYRVNYGYGFRIKDVGDKRIAYHHGRWSGFRNSLWWSPGTNSSIIILNNSSYPTVGSIERKIQAVLLETTDK